jgi:hypothetical protein
MPEELLFPHSRFPDFLDSVSYYLYSHSHGRFVRHGHSIQALSLQTKLPNALEAAMNMSLV